MPRARSIEDFLKRAEEVHGDRYDYSSAEYRGYDHNLTIICRKHGPFQQTPTNHYRGSGCFYCGHLATVAAKKKDTKYFIEQAKAIHGGRYSYESSIYLGTKKKVEVICQEHGPFWITAGNHYKGVGCTVCGETARVHKRSTHFPEFEKKAKQIHQDRYSYDETNYNTLKEKTKITCGLHGDFWQTGVGHLSGRGCPGCKADKVAESRFIGTEEFVRRAKVIHGETYSYDKAEYLGYQLPITATCNKHGEFQCTPDNHLHGSGCSKCGSTASQVEDRLFEMLSGFEDVRTRATKVLGGKRELDIYLPDRNLALEYNGRIWHSEMFHPKARTHLKEKQEECAALGIRLIQAFDYQNETVIRKTLVHILGLDDEKYYARQCAVGLVDPTEANVLLERNHLQGGVRGCTHYGLRVKGSLVAVMSLSLAKSERGSSDPGRWELRRFSSVCRVVGGASKLLKAFTRNTPDCESLISYSDNAWFTGKMYENLGFKFVKEVTPDYRYVKSNLIRSKSSFQRRKLATMQGFDFNPEESEYQNCLRNKWFRIWDCGKKKWELQIEKPGLLLETGLPPEPPGF